LKIRISAEQKSAKERSKLRAGEEGVTEGLRRRASFGW
jgi:hypothetical protein